MAADSSAIEQAVSRTLRDNLESIQSTSEELHQAINDLVAACASSRPTNALPPMIRAQTSASSLAAALDVLSRFVTSALQPAVRSPFEQEIYRAASLISAELATAVVQPAAARTHLTTQEIDDETTHQATHRATTESPRPAAESAQTEDIAIEPAPVEQISAVAAEEDRDHSPEPVAPPTEPVFVAEPVPVFVHESGPEPEPEPEPASAVPFLVPSEPAQEHVFALDSLPPEEQELHRRASRVAKVSMQDIKMLRPNDVRLGREQRDLCFRLRDDIEKAHKEYDRRFQSINSHPVDYFYDWMVEILAGGDPHALGEYPYPSPVARR